MHWSSPCLGTFFSRLRCVAFMLFVVVVQNKNVFSMTTFLKLENTNDSHQIQSNQSQLLNHQHQLRPLPYVDLEGTVAKKILNYTQFWMKMDRPSKATRIPFTIGLTVPSKSLARLEKKLYEVSHPLSSKYGQYLSNHELAKLIGISKHTISTVIKVLKEYGIHDYRVSKTRDSIHVVASVFAIEKMLQTSFHQYIHLMHQIAYIRADQPYKVPHVLSQHIQFISGVYGLPSENLISFSMKQDKNYSTKSFNETKTDDNKNYSTKSFNETNTDDDKDDVYNDNDHVNRDDAMMMKSDSKEMILVKGNHAVVYVPSSWIGTDVIMLALLRCHDGSFPTQENPCQAKPIKQVFASIDPVNPKIQGNAEDINAHMLFHREQPLCQVCSNFQHHVIQGVSVSHICSRMTTRLQSHVSNDTLFCLLTVPKVPLATDSSWNLAIVYEDYQVSSEALCFKNHQQHNCSKLIYPMPDVTPHYLHQIYNVPAIAAHKPAHPLNKQAVVEYLGEYYSEQDLKSYFQRYSVNGQAVSHVRGHNNPLNPGSEASLDIQVIMGVAPRIPTEFWSYGGLRDNSKPFSNSNQEPFLQWMIDLNEEDHPPLVHSVSYGDEEAALPVAYTDRGNYEFLKAGLKGITILVASGDDGVGSDRVEALGSKSCDKFQAEWPTSSPYVTSVGGTQMGRPTKEATLEEVVSDSRSGSLITTGGGFSYRYKQPFYQKEAVENYMKHAKLPPQEYWNRGGRAYPDISALATNYIIKLTPHGWISIAGTSASTPAVAGLISLLNNERLERNLPPMGFINPFLYHMSKHHPETLNDVKYGSNPCSSNPENCCPFGFEAAEGWDPTTGVGTLNLQALIELMNPVQVESYLLRHSSKESSSPFRYTLMFIIVGILLSSVWKRYRQMWRYQAIR